MKIRKKKSRGVFNYNGYILNHQDYNSKAHGIRSSKVITIFFVILISAFFLIGILGILLNLK